jgi:hypothetical protein
MYVVLHKSVRADYRINMALQKCVDPKYWCPLTNISMYDQIIGIRGLTDVCNDKLSGNHGPTEVCKAKILVFVVQHNSVRPEYW